MNRREIINKALVILFGVACVVWGFAWGRSTAPDETLLKAKIGFMEEELDKCARGIGEYSR